ncbi:MAG: hypothetical protein HYX57_01975 [Chloroflexi bacterium]|nr:hypothetical protein [Chloroflexota bacterium]
MNVTIVPVRVTDETGQPVSEDTEIRMTAGELNAALTEHTRLIVESAAHAVASAVARSAPTTDALVAAIDRQTAVIAAPKIRTAVRDEHGMIISTREVIAPDRPAQ